MAVVSAPFETVLGQPTAVELLQRAIACDRIAPAYLFTGPAGIGRRQAAVAFAQHLLRPRRGSQAASAEITRRRIHQRNHPDLLWIEPTYVHQGKLVAAAEAAELGLKRKSPPQIRLEQIRQLTRFLARPPLEASRSLVVIDPAETMAEGAANGLLKTLEEPGQATLILLAPDGHSLLPTLVSRCQCVPFSRLDVATLATVLERSGYGEILSQPEILAIAQGSPGAAIAHWQQQQMIPAALLQGLAEPPTSLRQALGQARDIAKTLDTESQLWLVNYLQHRYWQQYQIQAEPWLRQLEQARRQLLGYCQPRLVWEVALMALVVGESL
ncbi:MAG: DNA polymerase III subunit delta' [Cyanobacteria bacterium P01_D01_bin.128]